MISFPLFKGDAVPQRRVKAKGERKHKMELFKRMSRSQFDEWCSTNSVECGSLIWDDMFLLWRKSSTS